MDPGLIPLELPELSVSEERLTARASVQVSILEAQGHSIPLLRARLQLYGEYSEDCNKAPSPS